MARSESGFPSGSDRPPVCKRSLDGNTWFRLWLSTGVLLRIQRPWALIRTLSLRSLNWYPQSNMLWPILRSISVDFLSECEAVRFWCLMMIMFISSINDSQCVSECVSSVRGINRINNLFPICSNTESEVFGPLFLLESCMSLHLMSIWHICFQISLYLTRVNYFATW